MAILCQSVWVSIGSTALIGVDFAREASDLGKPLQGRGQGQRIQRSKTFLDLLQEASNCSAITLQDLLPNICWPCIFRNNNSAAMCCHGNNNPSFVSWWLFCACISVKYGRQGLDASPVSSQPVIIGHQENEFQTQRLSSEALYCTFMRRSQFLGQSVHPLSHFSCRVTKKVEESLQNKTKATSENDRDWCHWWYTVYAWMRYSN